jgi:hypothetical protein
MLIAEAHRNHSLSEDTAPILALAQERAPDAIRALDDLPHP